MEVVEIPVVHSFERKADTDFIVSIGALGGAGLGGLGVCLVLFGLEPTLQSPALREYCVGLAVVAAGGGLLCIMSLAILCVGLIVQPRRTRTSALRLEAAGIRPDWERDFVYAAEGPLLIHPWVSPKSEVLGVVMTLKCNERVLTIGCSNIYTQYECAPVAGVDCEVVHWAFLHIAKQLFGESPTIHHRDLLLQVNQYGSVLSDFARGRILRVYAHHVQLLRLSGQVVASAPIAEVAALGLWWFFGRWGMRWRGFPKPVVVVSIGESLVAISSFAGRAPWGKAQHCAAPAYVVSTDDWNYLMVVLADRIRVCERALDWRVLW